MKYARKAFPALLVILPFAVFSLGFYFFTPEEIVTLVRVENAYLIMFIFAFLGGVTIMSGVPYPLILVTFALGGLNPWYLGCTAASGVMLGDTTSYFVGYRSGELLSSRMQKRVHMLTRWYDHYPRLMPLLFFVYGACVPLPNDVITVSSGLVRYSFWRAMIPLALGNLVFATGLAFMAQYASSWVAFFV